MIQEIKHTLHINQELFNLTGTYYIKYAVIALHTSDISSNYEVFIASFNVRVTHNIRVVVVVCNNLVDADSTTSKRQQPCCCRLQQPC